MKNFQLGIIICVLIFGSCSKKLFTEFYEDGTIKEEFYKTNNHFNGSYKSYFQNGKLESVGEFKKDKFIGTWKFYYDNGIIFSIHVYNNNGHLIMIDIWDRDGNQQVKNGNGIFNIDYPSGVIKSKGSFKDSKQEGKYETWYDNGQKSSESYYKEGKPIGVCYFWDKNGKLINTIKY